MDQPQQTGPETAEPAGEQPPEPAGEQLSEPAGEQLSEPAGEQLSEPAAPPAPEPAALPAPEPVTAQGAPPAVSPAMPTASPAMPTASPAQPAVGWVVPTGTAARGSRSGVAAIAGVLLLVLGVIGALLGLLIVAGGAVLGGLVGTDSIPGLGSNLADTFAGFVAVIGVIVIVYSGLYIVGGIGILSSRGWGRLLGIVVSILSGLVWLAAVANPGDQSASGGIVVPLALLVAHAYVFLVLAFRWRAT